MPAARHRSEPHGPGLQQDLPSGHHPTRMHMAMGEGNRDAVQGHGLVYPNRANVRHMNCHGKVMAG